MRLVQTITRNEQVNAQGTATVFEDREHSWATFRERVARLADGLRGLGVADGDRVAMLALNSDRYLEWFYATSWAGAVFVPINIRLAPPEMVHWLTDSQSSVLFIDDTFLSVLPTLRDKVASIRHVVHVGDADAPEGCIAYEDLIADGKPLEPSERNGDDLAGLFYTGGTTGLSKGVMLSHNNLLCSALNIVPFLDFEPGSRYLHVAPMFHLANGAGMVAAGLCGATNVIVRAFEPENVLEVMEEQQVTIALMVPTMINALFQSPSLAKRDLSAWRTLLYGGSPMSEAVMRTVQKAFPDLGLIQAYGQTEASPVLTMLPPERHTFDGPLAGKTRSAGQAVYGVEVMIQDANGHEASRGEVGEICGRGDIVMQGYWKREEETRAAIQDGWLHTGDLGYMDDEGFVFVVDRLKDMIISGGENIYSVEVENAVQKHPDVIECAVFGIPHDRWGELVHAEVVTAPGAAMTEGDLVEHCRQHIAGYKCPRSVTLRQEELPKSGAGKILKRELREPYWGEQTRSVH